jgi:hypothetical protein
MASNQDFSVLLKSSLSTLLKVKPTNPYSFLSDFYFNSCHRNEPIFNAYACLLTNQTLLKQKIGDAFEILVNPSSIEQQQYLSCGVRLKDFFALLSFFCKGIEPLQLALGRICTLFIDSEERISFTVFFKLVLIHLLFQEITNQLLSFFKKSFPKKTISREEFHQLIQSSFQSGGFSEYMFFLFCPFIQ